MKRLRPYLTLLLLAMTLSSCVLPGFPFPVTPTPTATPHAPAVVLVATPTPGPIEENADSLEARRIAVYERVAPAVVNITTQVLRSNFFWGTTPEEGSGSGFLWDTAGHIVTNNHVVEGAQQIEVSFGGDASLPATVDRHRSRSTTWP